ncbi:general substrate transporter [Aaosphaeria arxii CBS 175.79]|uniref:General substrate transporter n=1 Tax=Aaosphaeria arxii CBS 175.79 TaxID=1450172 RepID=A0A6A5XK45_9PLEO|nr:general substrate transporter [Aaosphaeria arxii CBS 175.79]KAF2013502.1 general substrate transporter [Aaosphaeria arxii CBS 175.79]
MRLLRTRRYGFIRPGNFVVSCVAVAAGFGMLLLGYDQGVMAGLIGSEGTPFSNTFDNPDATSLGLMVAIYEIGCFAGAVFSFIWGETFSRRTCIFIGVFIMCIGATLQTVAHSMPQLIAGRIITGLGNGLNFSAIPTWASEISGHEDRGRVAAFNGWLIIWGVVIAYWVDYGCATYTTDMQFRFPIALQMLFGLIMAAMVIFLPESPRWLISRGYDTEAREVLEWITPRVKNTSEAQHATTVEAMHQNIIVTREAERAAEGEFSYAELLHGGEMQNWRRMALCAGVMACQQLSGINLLTYYISYVLENSVGLDRHTSLLMGGFNGLEYLVASAIPIWTIEKFGRRKLLLFSASGQTISMTILAGAIWYVTNRPDGSASYGMGILAVFCFFLFNTCYAQGFLAIPFFYPAEITTLRTRSKGVSISVMSNWLFTFLVVMITPICTASIGWKTYVIFAVLNISFIPFIYFFFPETAGLSLEALDSVFDHSGRVTRGVLDKQHRKQMLAISSTAAVEERTQEIHNLKTMASAEVECTETA